MPSSLMAVFRTNRFGTLTLFGIGLAAIVLALVGSANGKKGTEAGVAHSNELAGKEVRRFSFEYAVEIPTDLALETESETRAGADRPIVIFLPIATDATGQRILDVSIDSEFEGRFENNSLHGNRYWSAELPARRTHSTSIVVRYEIERSIVRSGDERGSEERARPFLAANERVVVGHPVLTPILEEIRANSQGADRAARARAIYDWIVDNVEYKKVGTGWGNGDTFWACSARSGNCTDFHSLFLSLARTEGIPARFQMGFPIPGDREEGTIDGYHCWVEFWLPDVGWIPIDASEAFKYPEKRELYYGTHPADRVQFTTGRDLKLGSRHLDRPLNYFIYPYLEISGKQMEIEVRTRFRYRERARS